VLAGTGVGAGRKQPAALRRRARPGREPIAISKSAFTEGKFREDLYYRLNVVPIEVPPFGPGRLHSGVGRVPGQRFAQKSGKKITHVDGRTLELLRAYAWPGNVRELQNVIERSVVLSDGEVFYVDESWLSRTTGGIATSAPATHDRERIEAALLPRRGESPVLPERQPGWAFPDRGRIEVRALRTTQARVQDAVIER